MWIKIAAKRSRVVVIAYYLVKDARARLRQVTGRPVRVIVHTGGRGQPSIDLAVQTARHDFGKVLQAAGLRDLVGRRVLEIGPGDDLGLCFLSLAHGAEEVVALDRFTVSRDHRRLSSVQLALGSGCVPTVVEGVGIEDAAGLLGDNSFDFIYSVAVLEHVGDVRAAFSSMARMLRPGGCMVHFIGGGDHGMFTDGGLHPLTYLRIPSGLYRLMTGHSGGPNRVFPAFVKALAEEHGWHWDLRVVQILGLEFMEDPILWPVDSRSYPKQAAEVERFRPLLAREFREVPTSELLVQGSLLVVHAPREFDG